MTWLVIESDCIVAMRDMPDASVDAVVCDPPYSLDFMGKAWDKHEDEDAGFGYYLSGLIDGEGYFRVDTKARRCEFAMKLRDDDVWILERARAFIGHGRIVKEPAREGSAPQARLIVDTKDGVGALCSILMRYPLRAKKLRDFLTWAEAVDEWLSMPRGNRWHGPADRARLHELGARLKSGRAYSEVAWSGSGFQDWCREWATEALRVLKPGGHLLAFGGTRTYHRLACGIEDAGFEVRDSILAWMTGQGFPKSLDVSKAIDNAAGAEREVVGSKAGLPGYSLTDGNGDHRTYGEGLGNTGSGEAECEVTAPATPEAEAWDGWGTALKPGFEPIVMGRKPFDTTVAANVLEHGVGAVNVAGCRIAFASADDEAESKEKNRHADFGTGARDNHVFGEDLRARGEHGNYDAPGRWPANVLLCHTEACVPVGERAVASDGHFPAARGASGYGSAIADSNGGGLHGHDGLAERKTAGELVAEWDCPPECPVRQLDEASADRVHGAGHVRDDPGPGSYDGTTGIGFGAIGATGRGFRVGDDGPASRFFYCAKTSAAERVAGLDGRNPHPTVKPIEVMRWLIRLVTPKGGLVLDPFTGSGSTGCAALLEGVDFVGIEREPEYLDVARARLAWWEQHPEGIEPAAGVAAERVRRRVAESGQGSLLDL